MTQKTADEVVFDFIAGRIAKTIDAGGHLPLDIPGGQGGGMPYVFIAQVGDGRIMIASNMDREGIQSMAGEVAKDDGDMTPVDESGEAAAPNSSGNIN